MNELEMFDLVEELSYRELLLLKECIEHEIIMSERAIYEGFENEKTEI